MSHWKFRLAGDAKTENQLEASQVVQMIRTGILGEHHEFQPPGGGDWLPLDEALARLTQPASQERRPPAPATPAASPKKPAVRPPKRRSVGRAPTSQSPPAAVRPSEVSSPVPAPVSSRDRRRSEDEAEAIDMTPMIDMTFLLLIFFMVASSVSKAGKLELPQAHSGGAEDPENRVVLVLDFPAALTVADAERFVGSKAVMLADTRIFFVDEPERAIAADKLKASLEKQFAGKPAAQFVLLAHRKMPAGVVREVLKKAKAAGAQETMVGVSIPR